MPETEDGTLYAANVPAASGKPLRADLSARLDRDVRLDNDANCFALSEAWDDEFTQYPLVMGLLLGTGVGGVIIINGKILAGSHGAGCEIGHALVVRGEEEKCNCGNHGCLEVMISEQALKNRIPEFGQIPSLSALSEITFSDLGKAATFRDPTALAMVKEMAWELSVALSNLISTENPSLIVHGGKIPDLGEYFLN